MKRAVILSVISLLLLGVAGFVRAEDATPSADTPPAACPVMGMAREVGLLVLGVGWEAVRIVLPDACPAKEKDIDRLLGAGPPGRNPSP